MTLWNEIWEAADKILKGGNMNNPNPNFNTGDKCGMKTTRAEICLSYGDCKVRVDTVVQHEVVKTIFEHLLKTVTEIDFNGHWKLENIYFFEEETIDGNHTN